jgi:hypothetical protein
MPYVVVPELHKDGHVHLHVLVGFYLEQQRLEQLWPHGFVDSGKARAHGSGAREAARKAGAYAAKYLAKAFEDGAPRRHRYEVAEGFQPHVVKRSGYRSLEAAVTDLLDSYRLVVSYAVHSDGLDDYHGAPFQWVVLEPAS